MVLVCCSGDDFYTHTVKPVLQSLSTATTPSHYDHSSCPNVTNNPVQGDLYRAIYHPLAQFPDSPLNNKSRMRLSIYNGLRNAGFMATIIIVETTDPGKHCNASGLIPRLSSAHTQEPGNETIVHLVLLYKENRNVRVGWLLGINPAKAHGFSCSSLAWLTRDGYFSKIGDFQWFLGYGRGTRGLA